MVKEYVNKNHSLLIRTNIDESDLKLPKEFEEAKPGALTSVMKQSKKGRFANYNIRYLLNALDIADATGKSVVSLEMRDVSPRSEGESLLVIRTRPEGGMYANAYIAPDTEW